MATVSNAERIVYPEIGATKGDVVGDYERIAARMLEESEGIVFLGHARAPVLRP